jgi:hypothetical protein
MNVPHVGLRNRFGGSSHLRELPGWNFDQVWPIAVGSIDSEIEFSIARVRICERWVARQAEPLMRWRQFTRNIRWITGKLR